jgi:hypothetical protein
MPARPRADARQGRGLSIQGGTALHVTGTGVIKSGPGGILHTVTVNTGASGATLALYDGTSAEGAVIAVIAATATVSLTYDASLNEGLYAVVSGDIDVTIVIIPPGESG